MKTRKFPLVKPGLKIGRMGALKGVIESGWLTQGRVVSIVEEMLKSFNNAKHAILVNSAASGLIAAVRSLGLNKEDEVIVPSFTHPATVNAVILGGATPVFCDIDLNTFNISYERLAGMITKRTKAIMAVSEFGLPLDWDRLKRISRKYGLRIIEDAACSLGAEYNGRKAGASAYAGVFSFHPRKILTCGEGGCLITNSSAVADKVRHLRDHGQKNGSFDDCGYNFRLSDVHAAVLLPQMKNIETTIKKRRKLASNYDALLQCLESSGSLRRPISPKGSKHVYQSYVVLLSDRVDRDKVKDILKKKDIETQIGTYCVPKLKFFNSSFKAPESSWKNAYHAYKKTLTLPLYGNLGTVDQKFIVGQLEKAILKCAG